MTKHFFTAEVDGQPRVIDVGYDRPMGHFYLNVSDPTAAGDEEDLYVSLYDRRWMAPGRGALTGGLSLKELQTVFDEQCIIPPPGLFDALREDEAQQRGSVIRHW